MHPLLVELGLDHPGLEPAKEAFDRKDANAALRAVVAYFRGRTEPYPDALASADAGSVDAAEKALRRQFEFQNRPGTVPAGNWDWTWRPVNDWEWTYFLNRHHWWRHLAAAYLATKDERYARELDDMITSWVGAHPPSNDDLSCWRTLEAGLRVSGPWPAILPVLKSSPSVTDAAWRAYLRSVSDHAEHLVAYPKQNNWLLMETRGLLTCAFVFPEFRRADEWLRIALLRFEREMERQIHPDGAHIEYSTGYHFVAINTFTGALDMLERAHAAGRLTEHSFSTVYREKIVAMWEYVMYLMRPDGRLPLLNDADQFDVRPGLLAAGERHGRRDFVYAATNGEQGVPPRHTSYRFPWVRRAVMRSGWDRDALYGFLETAPPGAGHVNEDALTFEIMAYGQPLVGTMGRYTYERVPKRIYLVTARGYNTVLIDGQEELWKRTDPDRSSWVATGPTDLPWVSNDDLDVAYGRYDAPWSGDLTGVLWERWLVFHKPDSSGRLGFWAIRDRFSGIGDHELRFLLHFFPGEIACDERAGRVVSDYGPDRGNVVVQLVDPSGLTLDCAKGQEDPPRGWFSSQYGKIEPAWEVQAVRRTTFPAEFTMVFVPFRGRKAPEVEAVRDDERVRVMIDGTEYVVEC